MLVHSLSLFSPTGMKGISVLLALSCPPHYGVPRNIRRRRTVRVARFKLSINGTPNIFSFNFFSEILPVMAARVPFPSKTSEYRNCLLGQ